MKIHKNVKLSEDAVAIIEAQAGDTFTQKFENLIFRLEWERKKKEERNKALDRQIEEKSKKLEQLGKALYEAAQILKPYTNVWGYEKHVV